MSWRQARETLRSRKFLHPKEGKVGMLIAIGKASPQSTGYLSEPLLGCKRIHPILKLKPFPPIGIVSAGPKFRTTVGIPSPTPA